MNRGACRDCRQNATKGVDDESMTLMCRVYTEEGRSQSCLFETLARQENEMGNRRAEFESRMGRWCNAENLG